MTQSVTLEDGSVHTFPDDATQDEMNAALPPMGQSQISQKQQPIQDSANRNPNYFTTAIEQGAQGLTMGWGNKFINPAASELVSLATGQPYSEIQPQTEKLTAQRQAAEQSQHPVLSTAAQVAGGGLGLISGGDLLATAAPEAAESLAALSKANPKMAITALGGGLGAIQGASEGEGTAATAKNAAIGAGIGAGSALGLYGLGIGAQNIASRIASRTGDDAATNRAIPILLQALKIDKIDPNDVADNLEEGLKTGKPLTALDVATQENGGVLTQGRNLLNLTKAAATFPGDAAGMSGEVASRGLNAADRIGSDFDDAVSANPFYGVKDQIGTQQKLASPYYQQFYQANKTMKSPLIDNILSRPAGRKALGNVAEDMQNAAARMAVPDPVLTEQARDAGLYVPGGVSDGLKGQTLDYVKQDLDAQAQTAKRSYLAGNGPKREWANLSQMSADLRNEMDRLDVTAQAGPNSLKPAGGSYSQARKLSAQGFQMDDALEQGRNFMQQDPEEIQKFFSDPNTSDPVKASYLSGQRRALQDMADNKNLGANPIASFTKPSVAKRLQASLGDSYDNLARNQQLESSMARVNGIHTGGSDTMIKNNYGEMISPDNINVQTGIKAILQPRQTAINALDSSLQKRMSGVDQDTAAEIMRHMTTSNPAVWRNLATKTGVQASVPASAAGIMAPTMAAQELERLAQPSGEQTPYASGGRINLRPTQAQKEAGNYKKLHRKIYGLDITIESPKGSDRSGIDKDGKKWTCKLPADYGYFKRTLAADGDHVDCYIGPKLGSPKVFVIDQIDKETGKYDECKVMLGYMKPEDAMHDYCKAFSDGCGHERMGKVVIMTIEQLKDWLKNGDTTRPIEKAA